MGPVHVWWLWSVLWTLLWTPHQHHWCWPGPRPQRCPGPGPEGAAFTWMWHLLRQSVYDLPSLGQAVWDGPVWYWHSPAEPPAPGAHRSQEGDPEEDGREGLLGDGVQGGPGPCLLEGQQACLRCQQQVLGRVQDSSWPVLQGWAQENPGNYRYFWNRI